MVQPHWLVTTISGALLGALVSNANHIPDVYNRFTKETYLDGHWYSYHETTKNGNKLLREGEWLIERDLFNRYKTTVQFKDFNKTYSGTVTTFDGKHAVISAWGDGFSEFVTIRILEQNNDFNRGAWFGENEDQVLTHDSWILSRDRLKSEQATKKLREARCFAKIVSCEKPVTSILIN